MTSSKVFNFSAAILFVMSILILPSICRSQNLLNNPESIVYDPVRDCYLVSNWGVNDGRIVRINNDNSQEYFTTELQGQFKIAGLYMFGDTLLAAAGDAPGAGIAGFDIATGEMLYFIELPGVGLPNDITSDTSGIIYVTDYWDSKLYKIIDHIPYVFMSQNLQNPNGILYDEQYNRLIMIAVPGGGAQAPVLQITLEDSTLSTLMNSGLYGGDGIIMDNDRNIYISEWSNDAVHKYDSSYTGASQMYSAGHEDPADIYFDSVNSLLCVPNFSSNTVDFVYIIPSAVDDNHTAIQPASVELMENYPNPFNAETVIPFKLDKGADISLIVYDTLGQEVVKLAEGGHSAGEHSVKFDGGDLPSGVYIAKLTSGRYQYSRRMLLVR